MPEPRVIPPLTVIESLPAKVPVNPVVSKERHPVFPVAIVHTPELLESKKTSSEDVGIAAPPNPPEVVDHFTPAVPSQSAFIGDTQNRLAIFVTHVVIV
jgi:hypothetical protein